MTTAGFASCLCALAVLVADYCPPTQVASPAQAARVQELLTLLSVPRHWSEPPGEAEKRSLAELVRLGPVAVPQLIRAVTAAPPDSFGTRVSEAASTAAYVLDQVGRPAVRAVGEAWSGLDVVARWKLMPFRGRHDYAAALPFALASLGSRDEWVSGRAVTYVAKYSAPRARKPLAAALKTAPAAVRWRIIDALAVVGGEEAADALIPLLAAGGWAALGEGQPPPVGAFPPEWPDGRRRVVRALEEPKAAKACPALLKLLRERGDGRAFVGDLIVPFLADHGGLECVPELRRIVASPAGEWGSPMEAAKTKAAASQAAERITARNG